MLAFRRISSISFAHSLGGVFALYLLRDLGSRVARLTLIDPVVVSVLRETGEADAYAEMEAFVEQWSGTGSWEWIGTKARAAIVSLVPKLRLEMDAARSDATRLADLIQWRPPTTVLVGEHTRGAPLATSRQLARVLGASTIVVPGAGHMIPLTHAESVVAAIAKPRDESPRPATHPVLV